MYQHVTLFTRGHPNTNANRKQKTETKNTTQQNTRGDSGSESSGHALPQNFPVDIP